MVSNAEREQLESIPLFAGVQKTHLEELTAHATSCHLAAGEILFADEDPADALFVLLSGTVEVFVRARDGFERVLGHMGPGMVLGEAPLLIGGPRSASARASEASALLRIPYEELRELIQADSPSAYRLVFNLAQVLATRLRAADDLLQELCGPETPSASLDDLDRLRRIFFVDWGQRAV